jgi:hypothetical protein
MHANGSYAVKKWVEEPIELISSTVKMTKASVEYAMTGEMTGQARVEYLMYYKNFDAEDQHGSSAIYFGLMRFTGNVAGKEGSFILKDEGTFETGSARSSLSIIPESGTGAFDRIQGTARYIAGPDGNHFDLEYTL